MQSCCTNTLLRYQLKTQKIPIKNILTYWTWRVRYMGRGFTRARQTRSLNRAAVGALSSAGWKSSHSPTFPAQTLPCRRARGGHGSRTAVNNNSPPGPRSPFWILSWIRLWSEGKVAAGRFCRCEWMRGEEESTSPSLSLSLSRFLSLSHRP